MDLVNQPFFKFDALSKVFIVDTSLKTNAGISYSDVFRNFTVFVCFRPFYTCLIKFVAWLPVNSAERRRFGLLKQCSAHEQMVKPLTKIKIQSGSSFPFERSKRLNSSTSIQISSDKVPFTLAAEPFFCLLDLAYSMLPSIRTVPVSRHLKQKLNF